MELAAVRHPGGHAEALPERPGGHVDEAEPGSGVTLQVGVDLPEVEQLLGREQPGLCPGGVQDGGGVTFGEYKPVIGGISLLLVNSGVLVLHHSEEEDGHELCHGAAGGRVAGLARLGHLDTVDPQLGGNVSQGLNLVLRGAVVQIIG